VDSRGHRNRGQFASVDEDIKTLGRVRPCAAVALVRAGKTITQTAYELGVSAAASHNWVRQDRIDRGEIPGLTSRESVELARAKRRTRELELEVEILRRASKIFEVGHHDPKVFTR
jgi:transposase-like protein